MKRITAIFLLLFYTISVSGMVFHIHFCGKKLQSISLISAEHNECCCGLAEMDSKCCANKTISIKSPNHHQGNDNITVPNCFTNFSLPAISTPITAFNSNYDSKIIHRYESPPIRAEDNELLIFISTFQI